MKKTLEIINAMQAAGVIGRYAIGGAMAAIYYTEPALTEDLDILLAFDEAGTADSARNGLVTLTPIVYHLAALGYTEWRKEGIVVEGWPVQFLPVADDLDQEALAQAEGVELDMGGGSVASRILQAEHLITIALRTGRAKDFVRIVQLLDAEVVDADRLRTILAHHSLSEKWRHFCDRNGLDRGASLA